MENDNQTFKSGFVTVAGRPNVGKSTLINNLIGEKISIISKKPQTTRNQLKCILTGDDYQVIFIDNPGIHKPKHKLGKYMVDAAQSSVSDVDMVLFIVESDTIIGQGDKYILDLLKQSKAPVILLVNKIDLVKKEKVLEIIEKYKSLYDFKAIIPVSAKLGDGMDKVIDQIKTNLPEGPKYFPENMITDQPERQIISEMIREKVLELLKDEVPHGIAVEIFSMTERENKNIVDIHATIYCEKKSHKGIIIGKNGKMLKKIGELSRADIEKFIGQKTYLELWVKIKKDWRNSENMLKNLGYK